MSGERALFQTGRFSCVRLICDSGSGAAWNMALDEALLLHGEKPSELPVIRLYRFSPPALSIGRFQKSELLIDFNRLRHDHIEMVRRPSGGQAVLHDDELTYCVVLNRGHLYEFSKRMVYRFVAAVLLAGLKSLGIHTARAEEHRTGRLDNPDCFASTSEYEIASDSKQKLIGSAQMITRGGILQHGSIPLGNGNRVGVQQVLVHVGEDILTYLVGMRNALRAGFNLTKDSVHLTFVTGNVLISSAGNPKRRPDEHLDRQGLFHQCHARADILPRRIPGAAHTSRGR